MRSFPSPARHCTPSSTTPKERAMDKKKVVKVVKGQIKNMLPSLALLSQGPNPMDK